MLNEKQASELEHGKDADFSLTSSDGNRQRVNVFRQQGRLAATIRLLNNHIPTLQELKLPRVLEELADKPRGLVLVTGPTGSGKSTTLAAMVDHINQTQARHIITIEDPIEYVYETKQSLIHQREVGMDTASFAEALRSSLREDPDVILVGEMRDYETISAALTAAETGHLVFSTLHTTGAAQTIDRIIDACPAGTQNQIRIQLSGVLNGVITQCLMPLANGQGRIAATEILTGTDAVLNLIREGKAHQMGSTMQSGAAYGMHTLNGDLCRLVRDGSITPQAAYQYSNDRKDLEQYL
jgi:twitching motility protein PilT